MGNLPTKLPLDQINERLDRSARANIPKSMRGESPVVTMTDHQKVMFALKVLQAYADSRHDALELYKPLPCVTRFHASKARVRLVSGVNQGGKTLAVLIELCRFF